MQVVVTGSTGFMGSALAAELLARGHHVLAPGRDPDGQRTAQAVGSASLGLGHGPLDPSRLRVIPFDAQRFDVEALAGVDAVWHVAAEMSYAPARLARSFAFNVSGSVALYRALRAASPGARFHHVSTAYVCGVGRRPAPEALLPGVPQHNTYLVTKWAAEMALAVEASTGGPELLIYRPPGVVGDSRTGWYGGKAFGSYNFYDAVRQGAATGASELHLDIDPRIAHPYLPIDAFVANAAALVEHRPVLEGTTVVHDLGTWATNGELAAAAGPVFGVRAACGPPSSEADRLVDTIIAPNKPFNQPGLSYAFAEGRLAALLGSAHVSRPLDEAAIHRIIAWFRDHPPPEDAP